MVAEINIKEWKCALVKKSLDNSIFHETILYVSLFVTLHLSFGKGIKPQSS